MSLTSPPSPRTCPPAHPDYVTLRTSAAQRKALWARDAGRCARCGGAGGVWHAEHIFPLWLVDRAAWPACLHYWTIGNLQTLCTKPECHPKKTATEAAARAKIKRLQNHKPRQKKINRLRPAGKFLKAMQRRKDEANARAREYRKAQYRRIKAIKKGAHPKVRPLYSVVRASRDLPRR